MDADNRFVWHPFTPMKQWLEDADDAGRIIVAGDGFELIDTGGRRYIDGFGSLWCNLHGHRVPQIDSAIRDQLNRIAHSTLLGHASIPSIELAERLVGLSPDRLEKVFYSDSGATAVEIALKMAFQYYRNIGQAERMRFIALRQSYHGDTIGAVSLGGIDAFRREFAPLLFDATFVETPNAYCHPAGEQGGQAVLRQVDAELSAGGEYCAVVVEPLVQGAAGMLTHPPGFLAGLRELTRKHDVLLIADEVATGFCRTGKLFACEHEDVSPDVMCLGKGLTGGYLPVAATLTTQEIFDAFCGDIAGGKTFYHGHTYTGNALGCAAAVASIDLIFDSKLLESLPEKVQRIRNALSALADHPHVGDIRQCGMMVGIELVRDRERRRRFDSVRRVGAAVCKAARARGVITRSLGDVVILMPGPGMDTETLDRLLDAIVTTIKEFDFPA
ncbi:MAG: adenosylmethionine--8-amino-7-oxononanoate transaminase [Planctomycetota bacterium]|jgi:adenosylmethionine-8-amino-7-oxononanoate aminotransferase